VLVNIEVNWFIVYLGKIMVASNSLLSQLTSISNGRPFQKRAEDCWNKRTKRPNIRIHGIKGLVIPTKSFVKIGVTKIFCYNNKMFSSVNKTFGCCSKNFGCSNKKKYLLSLILLP